MKEVLYIPFFSMQDKVSGRFLIRNDSNIHEMRCVIKALNTLDCSVDVLLPTGNHLEGDFNVIEFDTYPNNLMQRFHFDTHRFEQIFRSKKYDLIIDNTPALTKNLFAVYYHLYRKFPKVISITHYVDYPSVGKVPFEVSYWDRQVESAKISTAVVFLSKKAKDQFLIESELYEIEDKFKVWKMFISSEEIKSLASYRNKDKFPIKTILFPNRVSRTNHSNHVKFFKAIEELYKRRQDFKVLVSNLTKDYTDKEISDMISCSDVLMFDDLLYERSHWLSTAAKCHVVFAALNDVYGGVAVREAIYMGCIPVIPYRDEYMNMVPDRYPFFTGFDLRKSGIVSALDRALDSEYDSFYRSILLSDSAFEYNRDVIEQDLREVLYA
jgi:hypothetical protein